MRSMVSVNGSTFANKFAFTDCDGCLCGFENSSLGVRSGIRLE